MNKEYQEAINTSIDEGRNFFNELRLKQTDFAGTKIDSMTLIIKLKDHRSVNIIYTDEEKGIDKKIIYDEIIKDISTSLLNLRFRYHTDKNDKEKLKEEICKLVDIAYDDPTANAEII